MATGGGFKAIKSVLRYSARIGPFKLWQTVTSKNACKACAFGTGGQNGGIHNETGRGIEICNKNIQAHLSDVRAGIPATTFFERSVDELAQLSGKQLEDLGRLTTPLHKAAGDRHYSPITYDKALELTAARLRDARPEQSFFYASGRSSNEAAFLLQLMARLYGTNNINNCSYYCHQASGVALTETVGTSTATVEYDDIARSDLVFVFGANPASNHPRFVKALIQLRRRGGHVIVVNPAKEPGMVRFASPSDWKSMLKGGEKIASLYLQPHLGGDIALMHGIAKSVLERNAQDEQYIAAVTQGSEEYVRQIEALSWEAIERDSGVSKSEIKQAAKLYSNAQAAIFTWSMGLTHHTNGVENIQTLAALALLRGMVGKPGAGLLPLRGHSNIQGTGSMGFTPQLKQAVEQALTAQLQTELPQAAGLDTMACMHAAERGDMRAAVFLGGNILASNPDTPKAARALSNIPFKCFFNSTLNMSHVQGVDAEVIILPVRVRDEELQPTTQESMFNFVRLSDGGINRFAALRSEVDLINDLAERVLDKSRFDFSVFKSHQTVREWIAKVVPGFENLNAIGTSKKEFHIGGRILHAPEFKTANGRARFFYHPMRAREQGVFMLTSVRSEGQFNSIIFHENDSYREQTSRDVVLMHPQDIQRRGLRQGQRVNIHSETGVLTNVAVQPFDVREGNVMAYYPEANVLVGQAVDAVSRTPGFKSVQVTIEVA